jgi:surfeit locus 1 family protein
MNGRWRRLLFPGLMTTVMLALLIALGTWQIYRLHWKEGILAAIAAAEQGPAVPLPAHPPPWAKVSVSGVFMGDKAVHYGAEVRDAPAGPVMGSFDVVPLRRSDGSIILIDRGWAPDGTADPAPAGSVTVVGYVRPRDRPSWFSAPDDTAGRNFYTLDAPRIARTLGLTGVEPFVLVALGADAPGMYPAPARHLPRPPNNHLSYAITWYGLAAALLVTFILWARGALRA